MALLNFSSSSKTISLAYQNTTFFIEKLSFDFIKERARREKLRKNLDKIILVSALGSILLGLIWGGEIKLLFRFFSLGLLLLTYLYARKKSFSLQRKSLKPLLLTKEQRQKINILPFLDNETFQILHQSLKKDSLAQGLLTQLSRKKEIKFAFSRLNLPLSAFIKYFSQNDYPSPKDEVEEVLLASFIQALEAGEEYFNPLFLLPGLCLVNERLKNILNKLQLSPDEISGALSWYLFAERVKKRTRVETWRALFKPGGAMNRAFTSRITPFLDRVSVDLTRQAKKSILQVIVNREKEIKQIIQTLQRAEGNVVLVGPPGVGKSALVYALAEKMAAEDIPEILQDKRLIELNLELLIGGASQRGELEERLNRVLNEIIQSGNIILFIENLENLLTGSGTEKELKLSDIFMRVLPLPSVHLISTALPSEFTQRLEKQGDFMRRLQKIEVAPLNKKDSIKVLILQVPRLEKEHKVRFTYQALKAAVDLSSRYIHNQFLPAKAITILEESAVAVKDREKTLVTRKDIRQIVSRITEIPLGKVEREEREKLLNLEEEIRKNIIDQEPAISAVADALRRARAAVREEKRPIATFLFIGPTGVGKTELSKTLAKIYFDSEERMIRLDMSEYQTQESIARLLGSRNDYGAFFTNAVRDNPFSLVLLDELEKAHPEILNIFLQVFEDGRLTDSQNRVIDFTNTIIIATSNTGTKIIQERIKQGQTIQAIQKELIEEVLPHNFRPEFINRFTEIIVFKPLNKKEVLQITNLLLKKLTQRLKENQGVYFKWTQSALQELAQDGFDPLYGARPLRRLIEKKVESLIAKFILANEIQRGDQLILQQGYKIVTASQSS